jgi:hypothetical protein
MISAGRRQPVLSPGTNAKLFRHEHRAVELWRVAPTFSVHNHQFEAHPANFYPLSQFRLEHIFRSANNKTSQCRLPVNIPYNISFRKY